MPSQISSSRTGRFAANLFWTGLGTAANLFIGLVLSPYVIRRLGADGYGIWSVAFSLIGYYGMLDLGFRTAIVYFSATYRAREEHDRINDVLNTALAYYTLVAIVPVAITIVFSRQLTRLFQVAPAMEADFSALIVITAIAWFFGLNVFGACLEGLQRFDLTTHIYVVSIAVRGAASFIALALGYGLITLGLIYLSLQVISILFCYFALRSVFSVHLSPSRIKWSTLRELAGYGVHSLVANLGQNALTQSQPVLIGLFRPANHVGYFSLPFRLMQYTADFVVRMGNVTGSTATELAAHDQKDSLARLAIYTNRYSFVLFVPLVIFFTIYGYELIHLWITPEFAVHSTPLIPILVTASAIAIGGQFNSSTILYSLKKHKEYGWALLAEAGLCAAGIIAVTPAHGVYGAACVTALAMLAVRGLFTPWLLCRTVQYPLVTLMRSIYVLPAALGVPVALLVVWLKRHALPGDSWPELIAAGSLTAVSYLSMAFFVCLHPDHRAVLVRTAARIMPSSRRAI